MGLLAKRVALVFIFSAIACSVPLLACKTSLDALTSGRPLSPNEWSNVFANFVSIGTDLNLLSPSVLRQLTSHPVAKATGNALPTTELRDLHDSLRALYEELGPDEKTAALAAVRAHLGQTNDAFEKSRVALEKERAVDGIAATLNPIARLRSQVTSVLMPGGDGFLSLNGYEKLDGTSVSYPREFTELYDSATGTNRRTSSTLLGIGKGSTNQAIVLKVPSVVTFFWNAVSGKLVELEPGPSSAPWPWRLILPPRLTRLQSVSTSKDQMHALILEARGYNDERARFEASLWDTTSGARKRRVDLKGSPQAFALSEDGKTAYFIYKEYKSKGATRTKLVRWSREGGTREESALEESSLATSLAISSKNPSQIAFVAGGDIVRYDFDRRAVTDRYRTFSGNIRLDSTGTYAVVIETLTPGGPKVSLRSLDTGETVGLARGDAGQRINDAAIDVEGNRITLRQDRADKTMDAAVYDLKEWIRKGRVQLGAFPAR